MLNSLAQQLLLVLVKIIVLVVGGFAIKYFNKASTQAETKMGHDKFEFYKSFAKTIVLAVEQQFPDLKGENKYVIAAELLNKKLGGALNNEEIKQLIDAAVGEMNLIKKPTTQTPVGTSSEIDNSSASTEQTNPTAENSNSLAGDQYMTVQ